MMRINSTGWQAGLFHLLWSAALFVAVKFFIGNFYEVYEAIPPSTLTGLLMDGEPANIIYPIASIGLSDLYVKLYALAPSVAWYDYFMAAYVILSAAAVFTAAHAALSDKIKFRYIALLNISIFLLFFAEHILNWNYTRTSLMVCTSAFIWLTLVWLPKEFSPKQLISLFFNMLLFTIGVLIRPESGELIFILSGFFIICYAGITKKAMLSIFSFLLPVLVIAGGIWYDRHTSTDFYMQLEPVIEYQISMGNVVPISEMKTPEDSMKYVALREGMVNDPEKISYAFVKRVLSAENSFRVNRDLLTRAKDILFQSMNTYLHLIFLNLFLIAVTLYFFYNHRRGWLRYFLFHAFFWALVFFICYFMIMEARIFGPLLFFYTAGNFLLLFHLGYFQELQNASIKLALTVTIGMVIFTQLYFMQSGHSAYERKIAQNRLRFRALENQARNKMLIPDASAFMVIFFNNFIPFHNADFSAFKKVFLTDFEAVSQVPPYRAFLRCARCI